MRIWRVLGTATFLPLLLGACIFGGGGDDTPSRPRGSPPITLGGEPSRDTRACFADLQRERVSFNPLPDRDYGGGCQIIGGVQLLDIGVPVTGLKAMRCPLARSFAAWVRYAVAPAAKQILGSEVVRIQSYGTYACRGIVGNPGAAGKLSEHGLANAVDIAGFTLRDGRTVTVESGWNASDPRQREFLKVIHKSACRRFSTVLSPDYNAAHHNHLHLDMGRGPFCR